jgi:hypothetical protein
VQIDNEQRVVQRSSLVADCVSLVRQHDIHRGFNLAWQYPMDIREAD